MYTDRKKRLAPFGWIAAALIAALVAACIWAGGIPDRDVTAESEAALKAAVERGALQCYAVEGVYPPSLKYLEEHYGLQINHEDFYVSYEIFASNIPPEIRVTVRQH